MIKRRRILVLKIKKVFLDMIISGEKTVEIRKRNLPFLQPIFLFENETGIVRCTIIATHAICGIAPLVWEALSNLRETGGITKKWFDAYAPGTTCVSANFIIAKKLDCAISIPDDYFRGRSSCYVKAAWDPSKKKGAQQK